MARSPKCCAHIFFSFFSILSLLLGILALMTPVWLQAKTFNGGTCVPSVAPCGVCGPVVACNDVSDSPIGGSCVRWDSRAYTNSNVTDALSNFDTDALLAIANTYPITLWRAATGCFAAAVFIMAFVALFSLWNWTCCTKSERLASGALALCSLLVLVSLLLYFAGLKDLNDPQLQSVCDCTIPGTANTTFAAFATNPGNCKFGWSAGLGVGTLVTTVIASILAGAAKIPDEYYA